MRCQNAFSLRDLVAILCLAGLALPILAASVGGVVSQSAEVRCRTNLAALTRAVVAYAARNRGFMPVYQHVFTNNYIRSPDLPYKTSVCFQDAGYTGRKDPSTGLLDDVRNFGLVYIQGLARPPELFYCPSQRDIRSTLGYYPKPWGSAVNPLHESQFIRMGYMWNPLAKPIPGGSHNQYTYDDALALRRHPADWPLICDLVWSMFVISHPQGGSAIWNTAYPDGHVAPLANQELYDLFASGFDGLMYWDEFNTYVRPKLLPPPAP